MARAREEYENLPVTELQPTVRDKLSAALNQASRTDHTTKYWVTVAELHGFSPDDINSFRTANPDNPTSVMLANWDKYAEENEPGRVNELLDYLTELGVSYDNLDGGFMVSWRGWQKRTKKGPTQIQEVTTNTILPGEECLVLGDEIGKPKQFHTTLVYCNQDTQRGWGITQQIEQHGISVLFMDRDLLLGGDMCTMLARSIKLRSKTVLFLASEASMSDPICDFVIKFANHLAPGGRSVLVLKLQRDLDFSNKETLQSLTMAEFEDRDQQYFWPLLIESIRLAPARMPLKDEDNHLAVPPVNRRHGPVQDDQPIDDMW